MSKIKHGLAALGLAAVAALSGANAWALSLDLSGTVTDWGVSPFVQTGTAAGNHAAWAPNSADQIYWTEQNNYSPISYPGIGNLPSPGGALGEKYDLEAMYWRLKGDNLQVLVVTSLPQAIYSNEWRVYHRLGDLFIDVNGNGYDYAVATTNSVGDGLHANQPWVNYNPATNSYAALNHAAAGGTVYGLDAANEQVSINGYSAGAYGGYPAIQPIASPWVVNEALAQQLAVTSLQTASFNYGTRVGGGVNAGDPYPNGSSANESPTWFYEYTVPMSLIDPTNLWDSSNLGGLGLHLTVECGNDLLKNDYRYSEPLNSVPEPATMTAMLLALGGLGGYIRRRAAK